MRKRSNGDEIYIRFSIGADVRQRDAARNLEQHAVRQLTDDGHALLHHPWCHIVEQHAVGASGNGLLQFFDIGHLDLDG